VIAIFSKRSWRSSSSARSVSTGSMTTNFERSNPIWRQHAAADRAEADHHDRTGELGMQHVSFGHAG
jgi:hypothetical protein